VTHKYVLDEEVRDFMRESNPWALRAISERLLEAVERGLWAEPDPEDLDGLKRHYLETEGLLEEDIR
jgi:cobaltochelatase CobN